jgi:hypothetical protein
MILLCQVHKALLGNISRSFKLGLVVELCLERCFSYHGGEVGLIFVLVLRTNNKLHEWLCQAGPDIPKDIQNDEQYKMYPTLHHFVKKAPWIHDTNSIATA